MLLSARQPGYLGSYDAATEIAKSRTRTMSACGSGSSDCLLVNIPLIWQRQSGLVQSQPQGGCGCRPRSTQNQRQR